MNIAVKSGAILLLVFISTGVDHAAGNNSLNGIKNMENMEKATQGGQSNLNLKHEQEDLYLFPLGNAILNRL